LSIFFSSSFDALLAVSNLGVEVGPLQLHHSNKDRKDATGKKSQIIHTSVFDTTVSIHMIGGFKNAIGVKPLRVLAGWLPFARRMALM
jgi:hypothetical protein